MKNLLLAITVFSLASGAFAYCTRSLTSRFVTSSSSIPFAEPEPDADGMAPTGSFLARETGAFVAPKAAFAIFVC